MNFTPIVRRRTVRAVALASPVFVLISACAAGGLPPSAAPESSRQPGAEVSTTTLVTVPPSTAPPSNAATTTSPATTTPATTTPPTTEPACDGPCPIPEDDRAAIEVMVDAYNSGDWDAWVATLTEPNPSWSTPIGNQTPEQAAQDFAWSAGLDEVWTLGECIERSSDLFCKVSIEDAFHRAMVPRGLEPSACNISFTVDDGLVDLGVYSLHPCHESYDSMFHVLATWFAEMYPDRDPVGGSHYRGWNQIDVTAPARVMEVLPDFAQHIEEVAARLRDLEDE